MVNKMKAVGGGVFGEMVDEFADWTNTTKLYGSTIVINGFRLGESSFTAGKEKATVDIQFEEEPEHYGWSTEGKAVLDVLKANEDNMPFAAAVVERISKKNQKPYPVLEGV